MRRRRSVVTRRFLIAIAPGTALWLRASEGEKHSLITATPVLLVLSGAIVSDAPGLRLVESSRGFKWDRNRGKIAKGI